MNGGGIMSEWVTNLPYLGVKEEEGKALILI